MSSVPNPPAGWRAGDSLDYRGQLYECIGERLHIRKDGEVITLAVWRSYCARCGAAFEFATPAGAAFSPNRRCASHKRPGSRVRKVAAAESVFS